MIYLLPYLTPETKYHEEFNIDTEKRQTVPSTTFVYLCIFYLKLVTAQVFNQEFIYGINDLKQLILQLVFIKVYLLFFLSQFMTCTIYI